MAIFKNSGVMGIAKNVLVSVINFVWKNAIRWIIAGVICVLWTVVCIALIITSPIWVTVWALRSPERCSERLNMSYHYVDGWFAAYLSVCTLAMCHASLCVCTPIIVLLPMKYRAEFIRNGKKRVCKYPVKTQVAYYKSHCDGSKQSLLSSSVFSAEAREAIWNDPSERENWIFSGIALSETQVSDLGKTNGSSSLLCRYFKKNTPSKSVMNILIEEAGMGYGTSQKVLLYLIRQQRPDAALVGRLLTIDQKFFDERVEEILDEYADIDAVTYTSDSEEDVIERWSNFCKGKKEISPKAQKYMNHKQYKIYVDTGHNLDFYVLQHLLLSISNENYLKDVVEDEFDNIKGKMLLALKAEYWRYSVYLAVKEAKLNS